MFAADGTVHALVPGTGAAEVLLDVGPETVKQVEVSPDGSRLVTVRDSEVELWDLESADLVAHWTYQGSIVSDGCAVRFDPTGSKLLVAPTARTYVGGNGYRSPSPKRVVDARTGELRCELEVDPSIDVVAATIDARGEQVALAL
ncbi:MAG: hypothetical protein O2816_04595 [Planctomycetota bacterium]|nr:hypothetical protein [Planctomycetota bacterium]